MNQTAFDVMRDWDRESGIGPRSDEQLSIDVPGSLTCRAFTGDWEEWLEAIASGDVQAIAEGRQMWGLPIF